jgi:hypothetical protein
MYQQQPMQPMQAVTKSTKPTANGFHIFMGVITCGMWTAAVHLPLLLIRSIMKRKQVTYYQH